MGVIAVVVVAVTVPLGQTFLVPPIPLISLALLFPDFFSALALLLAELFLSFPTLLLLLKVLFLPLLPPSASLTRFVFPGIGKGHRRETENCRQCNK
jgi:hypothetical protein